MRIHELQIKVKSLGLEQACIRQHEHRLKRQSRRARQRGRDAGPLVTAFWSLRGHRVRDLRSEARSAQLALRFLRGRSYFSAEKRARSEPDWGRIMKIAMKFGGKDFHGGAWQDWLNAAKLAWQLGQRELHKLELQKQQRATAESPEQRAVARAARRRTAEQWAVVVKLKREGVY